MFSAASLRFRLATNTKQFALSCVTSFEALCNGLQVSIHVARRKERSYPRRADLHSMQNGSNGRNREHRPRGSRARFNRVRVPQVRVCEPRRSAPVEKANARDAITACSD
jgi:hypothetical protein